MLLKRISFIIVFVSCAAIMAAQDIVSHLESCRNVVIEQDARITELIAPAPIPTAGAAAASAASSQNDNSPNIVLTASGFRIRVFSGNRQSVSKNMAYKIQEQLLKEDPELSTYVIFKTPFWRLLVGDYRTAEEANSKLRNLRKQFPSLAGEMFIVKDEIIL